MIEQIAARHLEFNIDELIKTILVSGPESMRYKIEIYHAHNRNVSEPYHALLYEEVGSKESDTPHGVWEILPFVLPNAPTMEQCIQTAIETVEAHWATP